MRPSLPTDLPTVPPMKPGIVKYRSGYRWQLADLAVFNTGLQGVTAVSEWVVLNQHGLLYLSAGYATDGITGVTGWPWAFLLEKDWLKAASFAHDGMYQLVRLGLLHKGYRATADKLLERWCIEAGAWEWQAALVRKTVEQFGDNCGMTERPVLVAP